MLLTIILSLLITMGQPVKKLSELSDFNTFCIQYLPHLFYDGMADFHWEIDEAFYDRSNTHICLEAMRGSGKTTHSIAYAVYCICEGFDKETHIISRSGDADMSTALDIMDKIKLELQRPLLINDYGLKFGTSHGLRWTNKRIDVKRADGQVIKFTSRGKRASIRGARGTIIIDDPQDKSDCRSETVLNADADWFFSDTLPVLLKDNRCIFIGTSMSPLSLIARVKELEDFKVLSFPLEQPIGSGISRWEEHYPNEWIEKQKRIMTLDRFNEEYNCQPLVSGNPVFRAEWFGGYDPECEQFRKTKLNGLYVVTGMDGAESKSDQADYSALVTIAATYSDNPDIYILDVRRGHWTTKEGAEQLFITFNEFKQHKSIVESRVKAKGTVQRGDALIEEIAAREVMYGVNVNMYAVKPVVDKVQRAHYIQSMFQEGRIFFDKTDKFQQQLMSEMVMFTGESTFHDDMVDALVHALTDVKNRGNIKKPPILSAIGDNW